MGGQRCPRMDPGAGAPRLRKSACLAALVAVMVYQIHSAGPAFVGVTTVDAEVCRDRRTWATTMQNWERRTHDPVGLVYLRNSDSKGFAPQGRKSRAWMREIAAVKPRLKLQRYHFIDQNRGGHAISEVFLRFPGKTNWKRIGELSSRTGDFQEAVRSQWGIMLEHAHMLHPKTRVWLPTEVPVEFGYADEYAEIAPVKEPLPEGVLPQTLAAMLKNCGFVGDKKEYVYWKIQDKLADKKESKKDWHKYKPMLLYRKLMCKPEYGDPKYLKAKYRWKGRYSHWFGGMKNWAVKSHFQRQASSHGCLYPFGKGWPRRPHR